VDNAVNLIPPLEAAGPAAGDLLVLSWGGTRGACMEAVEQAQAGGRSVAHAHLRHLNPFPANLGAVLSRYRQVLIPELNTGQLRLLVRARFLVDAIGLNKVKGRPFTAGEIARRIEELL